jgi:dienelactone hydrolase
MRLAAAAVIIFALMAPAAAIEQVDIPSPDGTLKAVLLRPDGNGPFPAIVALHGCSGLGNRTALLSLTYRDWGARWLDAGYAVLFPDSFGSRGQGSQCTLRGRTIRPRVERGRDVEAAKGWLQNQPWVKPDRIFLVGWSHGGSTTLWAVRPRNGSGSAKPDFRAAVAFYPGCRAPARRGWTARLPTLILIGEADDWTPAQPCHDLVKEARERSARLEIVGYPGAYHAFDNPHLPLRQRTGLAYTVDGAGNAHIGTDPAARADAIRRVTDWLAR